jgi:hypothetical protein
VRHLAGLVPLERRVQIFGKTNVVVLWALLALKNSPSLQRRSVGNKARLRPGTSFGAAVFVLRLATNEDWRERRGSNAPAFPRFPAEKRTQTTASQRDFLQKVN